MDWIKWMIGFIGHTGLWCVLFNQIHATAWPRSTRKFSEKTILLAVLLPVVWVAVLLVFHQSLAFDTLAVHPITFYYFSLCIPLGIYFIGRWIWRKLAVRPPGVVVESKTEWIDLKTETGSPLLHGRLANLLGSIPFNEALKLTRQRMIWELDVPEALDGFKICHLSDLHFTGQIDIQYFQYVVEEANRFQPDLIFVTGDIVDKIECIDWIKDTIGNLRSRLGVYYVLGNHDRRIKNEQQLRERIANAGLIQASSQWHEVQTGGATIHITGNELPWYLDAESVPLEPRSSSDLKILLSHSPDQLNWALTRKFNLMFAGHTHGGQIALPFFGALVAPSKYGVLYASGTFQIDNLLMHVSRGISGDEPVRICSPPELGLITIQSSRLRQPTASTGSKLT